MSSVGLSGLSNISTQALQTRYERALKQINKLIQINRQLKEAANQKEAQASDANAQIATLQQANAELDQENNILDSKYMELEGHCGELETYCKQLEEKLQLNQVDRQLFEEKLREHEAKFQEELQNEGMKFNELARQAEIIHQVYQQNLTVIQEHQEKIKALEAQVSSLQQTVERLQLEKQKKAFLAKQDNAQILKKNLEHANAAVQRLNKQCSKLRGRQLNLQLIEEKQKLERYLGISAVNDPRQRDAVKLLINQYHKKIFNLQTGKKQLQHKYKHLKTKLLSSSAQGYQVKIDKLERLTEKQQMEIARLIETYDREINYLFRENVKLKQGLLSLSQRYKQKGMDVEEMERVILELRLSTQKVSFENQSLKKFNNSLIQAKSTAFNDSNFLNNHSESFKIFQKQKSEERAARMRKDLIEQNQEAVTVDLLNVQLKIREKSKTADQVQGNQTQNNSTKGQKINDRDFNFIQSVNIINGYNVNLGENSHYVKK